MLVAVTYESLREGPLPIVVAVDIVLLAAILGLTRRLRIGEPDALARVGSWLAVTGLAVVFWFFAAVVLLEGLTDRVPSGWQRQRRSSVPWPLRSPLGNQRNEDRYRHQQHGGDERQRTRPSGQSCLPQARDRHQDEAERQHDQGGRVAAMLSAASGVAWAAYVLGMGLST